MMPSNRKRRTDCARVEQATKRGKKWKKPSHRTDTGQAPLGVVDVFERLQALTERERQVVRRAARQVVRYEMYVELRREIKRKNRRKNAAKTGLPVFGEQTGGAVIDAHTYDGDPDESTTEQRRYNHRLTNIAMDLVHVEKFRASVEPFQLPEQAELGES